LPLVGGGNAFLDEPDEGFLAPEGWVVFKSTSSEDTDEDERDVSDLFRMGLSDASSLEVSKGMGLSNIYMKSQITIYFHITKQHTSWVPAIEAFI